MKTRSAVLTVIYSLWLAVLGGPVALTGCADATSNDSKASSTKAASIASSGTSTAFFSVVSSNGLTEFVAATRTPTITVALSGQLSTLAYSVNGGAAWSLPTTGTPSFALDLSSASGSAVVTMRGTDENGGTSDLRFTVHDGTRPLLAYFPDAASRDRHVYTYSAKDAAGNTGSGTLQVAILSLNDSWVDYEISGTSAGSALTTRSSRYPRRQGLNLAFAMQGAGYCFLTPLPVDPSTQLGAAKQFESDAFDCSTSRTLGRFAGRVTLTQTVSGTVPAGTFSDVVQALSQFTVTDPSTGTKSETSSLRAVGAVGIGIVYTELSLPASAALVLSLSSAKLGTRTIGPGSKMAARDERSSQTPDGPFQAGLFLPVPWDWTEPVGWR
ncbi:MAG: hypothetical protein HY814_04940 [Candidatus Riflebacteria bacterium]|nr:hypothetical protein [Candidatus Riflebacteria bacterium]